MTNVTLRPNITDREDAWTRVPGDIVEQWEQNFLDARYREPTDLQREERDYYRPCSLCGRHVGRIKLEGPVHACERNACPERNRSRAGRA